MGEFPLLEQVNKAVGSVQDPTYATPLPWNWFNFPVVITKAEIDGIHFDYLVRLLKGQVANPSVEAQLPQDNLPASIKAIDLAFGKSMERYQASLLAATQREIQQVGLIRTDLALLNQRRWNF